MQKGRNAKKLITWIQKALQFTSGNNDVGDEMSYTVVNNINCLSTIVNATQRNQQEITFNMFAYGM